MNSQTSRLSILAILVSLAACQPNRAPTTVHLAHQPVTTQLIGEGRLSAAPEYIELAVTVQSECYDSPAAASAATDAAVKRVMQLLSSAIDKNNKRDGLFSHGGFTRPFSRYANNRTVCENTFQKTTTVIMKSSRVASFAGDFARVQGAILSGTLKKGDTSRAVGITYANLAQPVGRLTHESRERLEKEALADALSNAREKLAATAAVACRDKQPRVVRFVERRPGDGRPIPYTRSQPVSSGDAMELDALWINKLLEVHFERC